MPVAEGEYIKQLEKVPPSCWHKLGVHNSQLMPQFPTQDQQEVKSAQ